MTIPGLNVAKTWFRVEVSTRERFDALAMPLLPPLYRFALGMTHNRDDAEDLVQEACVHAFRAFGSFRNGTNFKAWLFRICTNVYIDSYRARQHAPATMPLLDSDIHESPDFPRTASPEDNVMEGVMDEEIESALNALPDTFRAVVILSDMEGMAYEEVAHVLSIPIGTVRSRLFRGRTQMRASLAGFAKRRRLVEEER